MKFIALFSPLSSHPSPLTSRAWAEDREPCPPNPDLLLLNGLAHSPSAHDFLSGAVPFLSFVPPEPFHERVYLKSVEKSSACKAPFLIKRFTQSALPVYG